MPRTRMTTHRFVLWGLFIAGSACSVRPLQESPGQSPNATKPAVQQVRATDIGKRVEILGLLGRPLGELVTVRGVWDYPTGRFKPSNNLGTFS